MTEATTHLLNAIKSAYAAGLADGARQTEIVARIHADYTYLGSKYPDNRHVTLPAGSQVDVTYSPNANVNGEGATFPAKPQRRAKADAAPLDVQETPKAQTVARGVKKASGPREKGVKDGVIALLNAGAATIGYIVANTGFKETSVRGTLMQLKNKGLVVVEGRGPGGAWSLVPGTPIGGNGEADIVSDCA